MRKVVWNLSSVVPNEIIDKEDDGAEFVFPKFVRDEVPGMINKILRLEQEGESIHAKMNRLETKFNMILNKSKRLMLKEYENELYNM